MKLIVLFSCYISFVCYSQPTIRTGVWRGVLTLNSEKNIDLPFNFDISQSEKNGIRILIHNADERISVDEISISRDSLNFKMPVFDSEFKTKIIGDSLLVGYWINKTKTEPQAIPFKATFGNTNRFIFKQHKPQLLFNGKWEVTFDPHTKDSSKAIGVFSYQKNTNIIHGTFLTETGDYRFLEGVEYNNKLYLSCFDGSHAYLFIAEYKNKQIINGEIFSGLKGYGKWEAKRNEKFELRDPESLTYLKNPNEKIEFSFYNLENKKVSITDEKYKNKVVVLQVMGSWCPNCMDESAYLSDMYKKYHLQGLEIIALAYERTSDLQRAKINLNRLISRFGIEYDILLTGLTGGKQASESLPFLNGIMSFPTTLFLDRDHQVKSIYTGFSGPATGDAYKTYTLRTKKLLEDLLSQ